MYQWVCAYLSVCVYVCVCVIHPLLMFSSSSFQTIRWSISHPVLSWPVFKIVSTIFQINTVKLLRNNYLNSDNLGDLHNWCHNFNYLFSRHYFLINTYWLPSQNICLSIKQGLGIFYGRPLTTACYVHLNLACLKLFKNVDIKRSLVYYFCLKNLNN